MGTGTYQQDAELARKLQAQEFGVEDAAHRSMSPRRSSGRRSRGTTPSSRRRGGWRSWSWYNSSSRENTDVSGSQEEEQWRREDTCGASSSGSKDRRHDARREDTGGGGREEEHWRRREDTGGASSSGQEDRRRDTRHEVAPAFAQVIKPGQLFKEAAPPDHTVIGQWPSQDRRNVGQQQEGEAAPPDHIVIGQWPSQDRRNVGQQQEGEPSRWDHDMGHRYREDSPTRHDIASQQKPAVHTEVRKEAPNRKQQKQQAPKPEKPPERDQRGGLFGSWSSWTNMCTSGCNTTDAEEFDVVRIQALHSQVPEDVEDTDRLSLSPRRARHIAEDESTGLSSEGQPPTQHGRSGGPGPMPVPATFNSERAVALGAIAGGVTRGVVHLAPVVAGAAVGHAPGVFLGLVHSAQTREQAATAAEHVEKFVEAAHGVTQRGCTRCGISFKTSKREDHPCAYLCEDCRRETWHTWCVTRVQARYRGGRVRSEVARLRAMRNPEQQGRDMRAFVV